MPTAASAASMVSRLSAGRPTARAVSDQRLRRQALVLLRDRHGDDPAREPREVAQKARAVLGREHADDQHQRTRHALLEIAKRCRHRPAAVGVVAAVEPQLAVGRRQRLELAVREQLQRAGHSALAIPVSNAGSGSARPQRAQRRDRDAGVVELMAAAAASASADRAARRRPDRPDGRAPRARSSARRRPAAARAPSRACRSITASAASGCGAIAAGTPRLRIAAFSAAIFSSVSPRNSR